MEPKRVWIPGIRLQRAARPGMVVLAFAIGVLLLPCPWVAAALLAPLLGLFFAYWRAWPPITHIWLPDGRPVKLEQWVVVAHWEVAKTYYRRRRAR